MRRLFTRAEAGRHGITPAALRWGTRTGRWTLVESGVYVVGGDDPTPIERAVGTVLATDGVASGTLAGLLLGLDSIRPLRGVCATVPATRSGRRPDVRRKTLAPERLIVAKGIRCTDGLQTIADLAAVVNDVTWEQMLESALRKELTTVEAICTEALAMGWSRTPGVSCIRRVLAPGLRGRRQRRASSRR